MQDALPMGVVDGVADLAREVERAAQTHGAARGDDLLEGLAGHVFHHDKEHAVLLFSRGDGHDVGMVQAGQQPRFAQQLSEVQVLTVGNLEGDLLVDPGVGCQVDRAEASAAKGFDDLVLTEGLTANQHDAEYSSPSWQPGRAVGMRARPVL